MILNKSNVFVVAGEASADLHAAALLRELKNAGCTFDSFGVGGKLLKAQGTEIVVDAADLSIVGFTGWWEKLGGAWAGYRRLCRLVRERQPDVAVLLDLPDFNLMMARQLKRAGVPVVYYISPQVWAWRKYRIHKIKRYVDQMLVLFPFEKKFYEQHGVQVSFVGHPLMEQLPARSDFRDQQTIEAAPRIALLPGSRKSEIKNHAPILADVINALTIAYPAAHFKIPVASTVDLKELQESLGAHAELVPTGAHEVLRWADVAVVASGTATLETALIGTPFCLFYRFNRVNGFLFNRVFRYRNFLGMPNLLLNREVAKEFVHQQASATAIYEECVHLIETPSYRESVIAGLNECRHLLGNQGASARAAQQVFDWIKKAKTSKEATGANAPAFT